jgi:hypothetical protein
LLCIQWVLRILEELVLQLLAHIVGFETGDDSIQRAEAA